MPDAPEAPAAGAASGVAAEDGAAGAGVGAGVTGGKTASRPRLHDERRGASGGGVDFEQTSWSLENDPITRGHHLSAHYAGSHDAKASIRPIDSFIRDQGQLIGRNAHLLRGGGDGRRHRAGWDARCGRGRLRHGSGPLNCGRRSAKRHGAGDRRQAVAGETVPVSGLVTVAVIVEVIVGCDSAVDAPVTEGWGDISAPVAGKQAASSTDNRSIRSTIRYWRICDTSQNFLDCNKDGRQLRTVPYEV